MLSGCEQMSTSLNCETACSTNTRCRKARCCWFEIPNGRNPFFAPEQRNYILAAYFGNQSLVSDRSELPHRSRNLLKVWLPKPARKCSSLTKGRDKQ